MLDIESISNRPPFALGGEPTILHLSAWLRQYPIDEKVELALSPKWPDTHDMACRRLVVFPRTSLQIRRFAQLTNAFSKKFENHMHMVALYTVWYNYVKQHKSLKGLSPAMAAGISHDAWSMTDMAEMVDANLPNPGKRGPNKKGP